MTSGFGILCCQALTKTKQKGCSLEENCLFQIWQGWKEGSLQVLNTSSCFELFFLKQYLKFRTLKLPVNLKSGQYEVIRSKRKEGLSKQGGASVPWATLARAAILQCGLGGFSLEHSSANQLFCGFCQKTLVSSYLISEGIISFYLHRASNWMWLDSFLFSNMSMDREILPLQQNHT